MSTRTDAVPGTGYVEWGPVFAGAVLAAALSFVLLTFGAAIGLSATSPWPNSGLSATVVASLAVFWAIAEQIGAFLVGGYVAGRMRSRWRETGDEADFRDGLHGGLVWALGVTIAALLLFATTGAAVRTGADIAGRASTSMAASSNDPLAVVIDKMLRPAAASPASQPAAAAQPARPPTSAGPALGEQDRTEIRRLFATIVTSGTAPTQDVAYLAQVVAQRTGLSQQDAERRINDAIAAGREAADKARKATILTGLVTALGLIISFAAAWWAALKGGNHRDNAVPARFDFTPRRRTLIPGA